MKIKRIGEVPYADLGRGYETAAMVEAAYSVGRSGNVQRSLTSDACEIDT